MTRLVVLWERSPHLSREESQLWAWQQFASLRGSERVRRMELAQVGPPTDRFHGWFEWMVELEIASATEAAALVGEPPLRDVLAELRSLKLRPVTLVAHDIYAATSER